MERNALLRIWVRINQSSALFALFIATIGFAVAVQKFQVDQRKADEDRVAKAWDVVSRMAGKQSNGGQVSAVERLNSYAIALDFIDFHNTYAARVNLHDARLRQANLSGANLEGANFSHADLAEADLSGANLIGANLAGANLGEAKLRNARLSFAQVDLSIVLASDIRDADLTGATIVFEDSEDGEVWTSFSDSLADVREMNEVQELFATACANPRFPTVMYSRLDIDPPRRRCPREPNYVQLSLEYSRREWGIPINELLDVRLPTPAGVKRTSR
jgi:hypothetical protein